MSTFFKCSSQQAVWRQRLCQYLLTSLSHFPLQPKQPLSLTIAILTWFSLFRFCHRLSFNIFQFQFIFYLIILSSYLQSLSLSSPTKQPLSLTIMIFTWFSFSSDFHFGAFLISIYILSHYLLLSFFSQSLSLSSPTKAAIVSDHHDYLIFLILFI